MVLTLVLAAAMYVSAPTPARVEQAAIARAYAPVFVFHPDERDFPASPLFQLQLDAVPQRVVTTAAALAEHLGTADARIARYEGLRRDEKLALAAVYWRVYATRDLEGGAGIVAEYWCYYPFNRFEFHGGLVPYAVRDDHRHDLERVFIILERQPGAAPLTPGEDERAWARRTFRVRHVVASAHDGAIPANRFDVAPSQDLPLPIDVLVEHGSHAMAPDVDGDGLFTVDRDSSAPQHGGFVWGIRDHGETWSAYRSSYMDRRDPETAIRLCPEDPSESHAESESASESIAPCAPYALASADDLQRWFDDLKLTSQDRRRVVGLTSTVVRIFGDADIEDLMVPGDRPDGGMLRKMLRRGSDSERGLFAGILTAVRHPAAVAGARFAMPTRLPVVSELLTEAALVKPVGAALRSDISVLGFYRADAVIKLVGGIGWSSQERGRVDGLTGFECRFGRLRVRPMVRLRTGDLDTRIVLVF